MQPQTPDAEQRAIPPARPVNDRQDRRSGSIPLAEFWKRVDP